MAQARPRFKGMEDLTRTEAEAVIREANLGDENTGIAVDYFIRRVPQIDIAFSVGLDRDTVGDRLRWIEGRLRRILSA